MHEKCVSDFFFLISDFLAMFFESLIKSENGGSRRPSMRNVFLTHELMHCISGLDKESLRPSAIFTFDTKSCQF